MLTDVISDLLLLSEMFYELTRIFVLVMRGFMTARGLPDNPRSSRHILKDFVCGKLLYCVPPSAIDTKEFVECGKSADCKIDKVSAAPTPFQLRVTRVSQGVFFFFHSTGLEFVLFLNDRQTI